MKVTGFIFFYLLANTLLFAQSLEGVTGKADTSFTNYSAFINTKKTHPDIAEAKEFKFTNVAVKKNIVYCKIANRSLKLDAFYPKSKNAKAGIAIIFIHGGGWRSGNRTQHYL